MSPIWNPEFFGNTIVVNGRTWPYLTVEQRRYRFRLLNGCNTRFLILKLSRDGLPFWQIGADGGFLPAPVNLDRLLIAPGERADVIVDFTDVPVGTEIVLQNLGPDEPFGGGEPGRDFESAESADDWPGDAVSRGGGCSRQTAAFCLNRSFCPPPHACRGHVHAPALGQRVGVANRERQHTHGTWASLPPTARRSHWHVAEGRACRLVQPWRCSAR